MSALTKVLSKIKGIPKAASEKWGGMDDSYKLAALLGVPLSAIALSGGSEEERG